MTVLNSQIAAAADDCYVQYSSGWTLFFGDIQVGPGDRKSGGGFRFPGVNIPAGATITAAYLIFTCCAYSFSGSHPVQSQIHGEKSGSPAAFSTRANYQTRRGTVVGGADDSHITSAYISWTLSESWSAGSEYQSPDLKTILQEIIDDIGAITDLVLFWDDHAGNSYASTYFNRAYSYSTDPAKAAKLHIEYTLPNLTMTTSAASDVTSSGFTGNGAVTDVGDANPTIRGFCWITGDSGDPTTADNEVHDTGDFSAESFSKEITGLSPATSYRVRAYATNSYGTSYGDSVTVLTLPAAPTGVQATQNDNSKVIVTWEKSNGATGYRVYCDGVDISGLLGDVAAYDDTDAAAPVITPGSASAADSASKDYVALELSGISISNGETRTYFVVAVNAAGDSENSATVTGYRLAGTLTYQWQRSAADSDADYSDITGGTTAEYNDTGAPENGAGRYYRCVLNASGATQQTSAADRGYRAYVADVPLRHCGSCGEIFLEDPVMYEEPDTCPACGASLATVRREE
ncbi:MAG: hypothetical protein ABFD76_05180 [Smithella sp.]